MIQWVADTFGGLPWDIIVFAGLSAVTLVSALLVATAKRVTHACLSLLPCFIGIAGIYATLSSPVMLAFQLLIYAGGIMVLLLFAIFLLERRAGPITAPHHLLAPALLIAGLTCVVLLSAIRQTGNDFVATHRLTIPPNEVAVDGGMPDRWYAYYEPETEEERDETRASHNRTPPAVQQKGSNLRRTGFYFLTYYVLPFELTSLILVIAIVGAIIMARREKGWVAAGRIPPKGEEPEADEASDAADGASEAGEEARDA